ncbi:hypothetical protein C823_002009 [Eubacterium plexicaudatum ASF492]|nr:hypothetical protein C823_002009 [Eubacterium plexicaudatum ASF492]
MWQKKESKLELAASMVRQAMPEFSNKKNVIILCDSWYVKKNLVSIVDEYENLDLIGNARSDSVIYDLPPQRTGKRGRPALHGKKLSIQDDFTLSDEKSVIIIWPCAMSLLIFLEKGQSWHMSHPLIKQQAAGVCFSAQFFRNSFRSSAHGRRNPR